MADLALIRELDGAVFYRMLTNGYQNLKRNMEVIDSLNVFPVPDGDTGKNMTMTLSGGVNNTSPDECNIGVMLKSFSRGSLMSARGNSGVILSQIIRGMATAAKGKETITTDDFADLLDGAVTRSYSAVTQPVEGTILTVIKDAADYAKSAGFSSDDFNGCLTSTIEAMKASLLRTPELLPVLKEAGVVDSGGAGLVCFFEGMLMELNGRTLNDDDKMSWDVSDFHINTAESREHVRYALVAVANGEGIIRYFREAGVAAVIDGGQTNNPSAEDFIRAFRSIDADHLLVLPSNGNIIMTAEQAAKMYDAADVHVLATKSIAETYSAISMFDPSADTVDEVIENMIYYYSDVVTGYVTTATRNANIDGVAITEGDYIGLTGDTIYSDSPDLKEAAIALITSIPNIEDKQVVNIFFGKGITLDEALAFGEEILRRYPMIEIGYVDGGQDVYRYIIAIE